MERGGGGRGRNLSHFSKLFTIVFSFTELLLLDLSWDEGVHFSVLLQYIFNGVFGKLGQKSYFKAFFEKRNLLTFFLQKNLVEIFFWQWRQAFLPITNTILKSFFPLKISTLHKKLFLNLCIKTKLVTVRADTTEHVWFLCQIHMCDQKSDKYRTIRSGRDRLGFLGINYAVVAVTRYEPRTLFLDYHICLISFLL